MHSSMDEFSISSMTKKMKELTQKNMSLLDKENNGFAENTIFKKLVFNDRGGDSSLNHNIPSIDELYQSDKKIEAIDKENQSSFITPVPQSKKRDTSLKNDKTLDNDDLSKNKLKILSKFDLMASNTSAQNRIRSKSKLLQKSRLDTKERDKSFKLHRKYTASNPKTPQSIHTTLKNVTHDLSLFKKFSTRNSKLNSNKNYQSNRTNRNSFKHKASGLGAFNLDISKG